MVLPKKQSDRPAIARVLATFEGFQQQLMAIHADDFTTLDITMAQAKLLYVLMAGGEMSVSEIGRRLGITVSTASGAVDHLVGMGYLARSDDPANRRQVRVSVTPLGSGTLEQVRELSTRQLRALFELLSDDELDVIDRAAQIMASAVSKAVEAAASASSPTTQMSRSTR